MAATGARSLMPPLAPSIFGNVVPFTQRARDEAAERQRLSAKLREEALSPFFTSEMYGVEPDYGQTPDDLMTPPAEARWGPDFLDKTCEDMGRNVLEWRSLLDGALDLGEHLKLEFLPGMPGDAESELAAEAVRIAWAADDERAMSTRGLGAADEKGFCGAENLMDVITRGVAKDLVYPAKMIPRPTNYFGFDFVRRARLKRDLKKKPARELPIVPDFKVSFMRCGSLHTDYGHGKAEDAYPTVFEIDRTNKEIGKISERWGYLPLHITVPWPENDPRFLAYKRATSKQWKNFILVSGETTNGKPDVEVLGAEGAAAANTTINAMLAANRERLEWLAHFAQGTQYSSGSQQAGSFARDKVASDDRMFKAPTYAACKEASINRGFIAFIMIVNFPTMDRAKWPRASIDSSFGEDLVTFMQLCESGAKQGIRIAAVTWSERTGIPIVPEDDIVTPLLRAPAAPVNPVLSPDQQAAQAFAEPRITIWTKYGMCEFPPDYPLEVEGASAPVRAANVLRNQTIVTDPRRFRIVR